MLCAGDIYYRAGFTYKAKYKNLTLLTERANTMKMRISGKKDKIV